MTHRAYKNYGGDRDKRGLGFSRLELDGHIWNSHKGVCACGVETSSTVAGIGYECASCYQERLKKEVWNVDPRR